MGRNQLLFELSCLLGEHHRGQTLLCIAFLCCSLEAEEHRVQWVPEFYGHGCFFTTVQRLIKRRARGLAQADFPDVYSICWSVCCLYLGLCDRWGQCRLKKIPPISKIPPLTLPIAKQSLLQMLPRNINSQNIIAVPPPLRNFVQIIAGRESARVHLSVPLSAYLDGIHLLSEFLDLIHQALVLLLRCLFHSTTLSKLNKVKSAEK